ncbi:hypothetical protein BH23ACT9_BH23ACT9_37900 [soil metagenome]
MTHVRVRLAAVPLALLVLLALVLQPMSARGAESAPTDDRGGDIRNAVPDRGPSEFAGAVTAEEDGATFAQADQCRIDPTGDVVPAHPVSSQADIVRFCGPTSGTSSFTLDLLGVPNPAVDANWVFGITGWFVDFDVDFDGFVDYDMLFYNDGSRVTVDVLRYADDRVTCSQTATFSGNRLSTTLAPACLDGAQSFSYFATMFYDSQWDDPNAPVLVDDMSNSSPEDAQPAPPPPPAPAPGRDVQRLAGPTRIDTSIEISRYQFPGGASEVYLSRSDEFADSISSGSLTRGPVLLVPQCGPVPAAVLAEVRRLNPGTIVALGGPAAVCDQVVADVAAA